MCVYKNYFDIFVNYLSYIEQFPNRVQRDPNRVQTYPNRAQTESEFSRGAESLAWSLHPFSQRLTGGRSQSGSPVDDVLGFVYLLSVYLNIIAKCLHIPFTRKQNYLESIILKPLTLSALGVHAAPQKLNHCFLVLSVFEPGFAGAILIPIWSRNCASEAWLQNAKYMKTMIQFLGRGMDT